MDDTIDANNDTTNASRSMNRNHAARALFVFAALACAGTAGYAAYPEKPVRIVVGSAPGGGTDSVVRTMAPRMSQVLGQQMLIDNRVGAAGAIAARQAARAAPDGYTLLATFATHATNLGVMKDPGYDLEREFTPISLTVTF